MTYFNGSGGYYWLGKYVPLVKTDRVYCDDCAEAAIPLPAIGDRRLESEFGFKLREGNRHHATDFKWAPFYGGDTKCMVCGKAA